MFVPMPPSKRCGHQGDNQHNDYAKCTHSSRSIPPIKIEAMMKTKADPMGGHQMVPSLLVNNPG